MLRSLGVWKYLPQVGRTVHERRMVIISVAFSNRENTKKLEFHEIIESRILRILLDSTEKSFLRRDPLRYLFFSCFFIFISRFRGSIRSAKQLHHAFNRA